MGKERALSIIRLRANRRGNKEIPASVICKDAPTNITNGLEAIQYLRNTYKRTISFEFDHVHDFKEREWLTQKIESGELFQKNSAEKLSAVLERLMEVEGFEQFLHRTFAGQKRFSIEGLDALVPVLDDIIAQSVKSGTTSVNIGMAHRGRLNVLAHVLGKPYEIIFSEFQHAPNKDLVPSEGSIGISYGWTGMSNIIWERTVSFMTLKRSQRALRWRITRATWNLSIRLLKAAQERRRKQEHKADIRFRMKQNHLRF